jgi:hypothetical protein
MRGKLLSICLLALVLTVAWPSAKIRAHDPGNQVAASAGLPAAVPAAAPWLTPAEPRPGHGGLEGTLPSPVPVCVGCTHSFCNSCIADHARCELVQPNCQCVCVPGG